MGFSWARALTWLVVAGIGAAYGVAGTIAHSYSLGMLPVGLVLSVIGVGALLAAVRLLTADRWAALAAGFGTMVTTLVFSGEGPGGSVIVAQARPGDFDAGLVWTIAVPVMVAVAVAWPDLRGITAARPADRPASRPAPEN